MKLDVEWDQHKEVPIINGRRPRGRDIGNCRFVCKYKGKILKVDDRWDRSDEVYKQTARELELLTLMQPRDKKLLPKVYATGTTSDGKAWILEELIKPSSKHSACDFIDLVEDFQERYDLSDAAKSDENYMVRKNGKPVITDWGY